MLDDNCSNVERAQALHDATRVHSANARQCVVAEGSGAFVAARHGRSSNTRPGLLIDRHLFGLRQMAKEANIGMDTLVPNFHFFEEKKFCLARNSCVVFRSSIQFDESFSFVH